MINTFKACMICLGMMNPAVRGESALRTYDQLLKLNPYRSIEDPADWPLKITSLLRSEYDFFRGTADLFYAHAREVCADWIAQPQYHITIHGDVHLGNIGTFQSTGPLGGDLHFGLVDFDEAFIGPFQFDLLRGMTALRMAAATSRIAVTEREMADVSKTLITNYAAALQDEAASADDVGTDPLAQRAISEARNGTLTKYVSKYTEDGAKRFRRVRASKGKVQDVMRPLDEAEKLRAISALGDCYEHSISEVDRRRLRFRHRAELESAVLDVVLWTRIESSGSQGLRKYLMLLDAPLRDSNETLILQLKEEPECAAARAGLVALETGAKRAAFVCNAYRSTSSSPRWLLAHLAIADTGFLVMTKDPWCEELSTKNILTFESLRDGAALMGRVIGRGHRKLASGTGRLESIIKYVSGNADQLFEDVSKRSLTCQYYLTGAYQDLKSDQRALELSNQGQAWIARFELER